MESIPDAAGDPNEWADFWIKRATRNMRASLGRAIGEPVDADPPMTFGDPRTNSYESNSRSGPYANPGPFMSWAIRRGEAEQEPGWEWYSPSPAPPGSQAQRSYTAGWK